jgi:hypothetical protein
MATNLDKTAFLSFPLLAQTALPANWFALSKPGLRVLRCWLLRENILQPNSVTP